MKTSLLIPSRDSVLRGVGLCLVVACGIILVSAAEDPESSRQVLVLGGNGFMGADTVEALVKRGDTVTIVNRGNWYWDSEDRIKPNVAGIVHCDRKKEGGLAACQEFTDFLRTVEKFDVVIDFSAYTGEVVIDASQVLKDKVEFYILLSSDSVYDVCEKNHDGPSMESDAIRPEDSSESELLNRHHDYGHRKLQAEEELVAQRQDGGFPYFILRLPDVIGPRDTTYRWWIYQLWVTLASEIPESPLKIPAFLENYPMSFVYVNDVTRAIEQAIDAGVAVHDQTINLGWAEYKTTEELLRDMGKHLGFEDLDITTDDSEDGSYFYLYPSVRKGPMDVSKVQEILPAWEPTPWDQVLQDTLAFYNEAMKGETFLTQRDEIVQIVSAHLYDKIKEKFYIAVEKHFDINLHHFRPRDEL